MGKSLCFFFFSLPQCVPPPSLGWLAASLTPGCPALPPSSCGCLTRSWWPSPACWGVLGLWGWLWSWQAPGSLAIEAET